MSMHTTPGAFISETIDVNYTGSDTLKAGYALCRDVNTIDDTVTGTGVGGGSVTRPADQSGIAAAKPSFANLNRFLGVVAPNNAKTQLEATGARTIKIIPFWAFAAKVPLWSDESITIGDLLGIQPGSYAFVKGAVFDGKVWARADETQDRSSTEGTVKSEFGSIVVTPQEYAQRIQVYDNDFMEFDANEIAEAWITTETGAATQVIADAVGGELLLTNAASDDDACFMQHRGEKWKCAAGKPLFFYIRFKVNDDDQIDWIAGLNVIDTTPLAAQDGITFRKDDGDTNIDFNTDKDGTQTDADTTLDAVASQYLALAFFFDGTGAVKAYGYTNATAANVNFSNLALLLTHTTNICDDEEMTITFGVQNGEAVAKTMNIDRIIVRQAK